MFRRNFILLLLLIIISNLFIFGCSQDNNINKECIKTELLVLDKSNNYIELEDCPTTNYNNLNIKIIENDGSIRTGNIDDLYIGMENIYVEYNDEFIETILIDKNPLFSDIRVAIRNDIKNINNIEGLYHETVELNIKDNSYLKTFDGKEKYDLNNSLIKIEAENDKIIIGDYKTNKRIFIESEEEMKILSIERSLGNPSYSGRLEFKAIDGKILVINKVNMEDYLRKVVPSEMPASWNLEALKSQAVAARTYAYHEIYNKSFMDKGYIVDDSEVSQVYNNLKQNEKVSKAVEETKGITMFYGEGDSKLPIKAYYYSSSSGLTASGNEVWIENKKVDEIPYAIGKNLTSEDVILKDEKSMISFFKKIDNDSISGDSVNHRWHIKLSKEDLREILNKNLKIMAKKYPNSFFVYKNKKWIKSNIPNDIGKVNNVYIGERGQSGVVMSLIIDAEKGSYKICNQYNIRFTLKPNDSKNDVYIEKGNNKSDKYTTKILNPSVLPSAFFALEWENNNLHIYGGGLGHGVGMCQYGANFLGIKGFDYQKILNTFYNEIEFIDTSKEYQPLEDFHKYFN